MKKLMIAAAIVCAAALSQAAQFSWTAANITNPNGEGLYSGNFTAYFTSMTDVPVATYTDAGSMENGAFTGVLVGGDEIVGNTIYKMWYTMTAADGSVFTSTVKTMKAQQMSNPGINFMNGGSWQTVPEPTSGLLLLLGVAGLALRRKQK